jgi:hypothetical protein
VLDDFSLIDLSFLAFTIILFLLISKSICLLILFNKSSGLFNISSIKLCVDLLIFPSDNITDNSCKSFLVIPDEKVFFHLFTNGDKNPLIKFFIFVNNLLERFLNKLSILPSLILVGVIS